MVQRHELNLFRKPISSRYVAVAFHKHAFDHEYRIVRREHPHSAALQGPRCTAHRTAPTHEVPAAQRSGSGCKCVFDAYLLTTFIRLYDAQRSPIGGRRVGRHYTRSGLAM
jgi:hypothetical protein